MNVIGSFLFCCMLISGFNPGSVSQIFTPPMSPDVYRKYITDHQAKFTTQKSFGEKTFTLTYIPAELKIINQFNKGFLDQFEAQQQLIDSKNKVNLLLHIQFPQSENQDFINYKPDTMTYEARLKYLAFEMGNDMQLVDEKGRKLEILDCRFERDFGMTSTATFSIIANKNNTGNEITISIYDRIWDKDWKDLTFTLPKLPKLKKTTKWKKA